MPSSTHDDAGVALRPKPGLLQSVCFCCNVTEVMEEVRRLWPRSTTRRDDTSTAPRGAVITL